MASCDKCERKPNTVDGQCPVYNMADGRHFTDYRPRCVQNNSMVNTATNVLNSYEYRMYLQHNAKKISPGLCVKEYAYVTICQLKAHKSGI